MKRWLPSLRAAILLVVVAPLAVTAQEPPDRPFEAPPEARALPDTAGHPGVPRRPLDSYVDFEKLVEHAVSREGFFDTYETESNLFLAIPPHRLGEEFLLSFKIAEGVGAGGLQGGTLLGVFEGRIVALERHGEDVFLVQRPHRFTARPGTPAREAVDISFGSSILQYARIESVREDSALIIDIMPWMLSDLSDVRERVRRAVERGGRASLDSRRSYLKSVNAFPENLNIQAQLTFSGWTSLPSVPDGRFLPLSVHYTLARLPAERMIPRAADDRIGYFVTARKDFSDDSGDFFVRYVNRWRLEAGSAVDGLYEPREPIVYYLDRNIPEEYRPYVREGIEAWNEAFESAGWRNAVRAEVMPEDAQAEDIRYPTVRWTTSDRPSYGAIGPSIVDPRTGEILDAEILVEASTVAGFRRSWQSGLRPAAALEGMLRAPSDVPGAEDAGTTLGAELAAQGGLLRTVLAAQGTIGPSEPVPMRYVGEAVKWIVMHEVGHTLGLRHNFRSSIDTPLERLHDPEWARERGISSSVMEYPAINLSPESATPYRYNPAVGSYDRWAISYGYVPSPEEARLLARQGARRGHSYGTDEDARGRGALDPTVNVYDLGSDPLEWAKSRAELVADLWPRLPEQVLTDDARYANLTDAFRTLLVQYARTLAPAVKYVGGQYQHRDHVGDPDGRLPFVNVGKERQREALDFLMKKALDEEALDFPSELVARFGANRWSHWGERSTYGGRIDYPLGSDVLSIQRSLLRQLTDSELFARVRDAELRHGSAEVLTVPELLETLGAAVWSEVYAFPGRNIRGLRRDLQRVHLERMFELLEGQGAEGPSDARALARMELARIAGRIEARLSDSTYDDYTRAHLLETSARIDRALQGGDPGGEMSRR